MVSCVSYAAARTLNDCGTDGRLRLQKILHLDLVVRDLGSPPAELRLVFLGAPSGAAHSGKKSYLMFVFNCGDFRTQCTFLLSLALNSRFCVLVYYFFFLFCEIVLLFGCPMMCRLVCTAGRQRKGLLAIHLLSEYQWPFAFISHSNTTKALHR